MPRRPAPFPDLERQELAHARRMIGLRIAAVTTIVMLFIGAVVYVMMLTAQNNTAQRELHWVAAYSAPSRPPPCTWLAVRHQNGRVETSPGMPEGFPLRESLARVADGGDPLRQQLRHNDVRYQVLTTNRGDDVVQAIHDARFQDRTRNLLLISLAVAEAIGVLGAMLAGSLLAWRAMTPLAEALRRQRQFVADASHELRNPVTRLHTRAQLLVRRSVRRRQDLTDRDLAKLVDDTRQLGDIIDDLLLATRVRGGDRASGEPTAELLDLAALADAASAAEADRARQAKVTVTVSRGPGPHTVVGVRTALLRVVGALLDNALGHTPPGGHITITIAQGSTGSVVLSVRDDGEGFDQHDAHRLFERFARGAGSGGRRFGIGLSLVREVVLSHRGTVTAEGVPGQGASFTVTLPASAGRTQTTGSVGAAVTAERDTNRRSAGRVPLQDGGARSTSEPRPPR